MAQAEPSDILASCGGDEFVSAMSSEAMCEYVTACMSDEQIRDDIETSIAQGWSELRDGGGEGGRASGHADDIRVWEELKKRNPHKFVDFKEGELKLGRMIAEGGQAQIFEASMFGCNGLVAKVFKREGFSLADLQRQWPLATKHPGQEELRDQEEFDNRFVLGGVVFGEIIGGCCGIFFATLLKDGRFAFVMRRYSGDLRTLINRKMKDNNFQGPPFSHTTALNIMSQIAWGMNHLHGRGVLHRDLKAANILVRQNISVQIGGVYLCWVADYESAMFVQGTGFWRAPEVLQELLKNPSDRDVEISIEKVDVYSYAMTCYEVLTGHIPFDGYGKSHWKKVIDGERPQFPDYVDPRLRKLVERCWHKEHSCRPSFDMILVDIRRWVHL